MNRDASPAQGGKKKVAASWTCWQHGEGVLMIVSHSLAPSGSKRGSSDPRLKWEISHDSFSVFFDGTSYRPWRSWRSKTSEAMDQNVSETNRSIRDVSLMRWHTRKSRDGQEDQEGRWRDQRFIDFVVLVGVWNLKRLGADKKDKHETFWRLFSSFSVISMTHGDNCEINLAIFPPWPAGHNQQMWNTKSCRSQVQNPRPQQRTPRTPNPARLPLQKRVEMMEMNPWGAELGHHESQKSRNCHQNCWVIVMSYEQKASLRERDPSEAWVESASKQHFVTKTQYWIVALWFDMVTISINFDLPNFNGMDPGYMKF